jgi:hypothetical protein
MTPQLWIGFGFLALLVIFLICSFFFLPKLTNDQRGTLKFLTALCAAFAGGFITGDALLKVNKTVGATEIAISGTAGFALFFAIWFFYPKVFRLEDGFEFSVPEGWTFRDTADSMAQSINSLTDYQGFTDAELKSVLKSRKLSTKSIPEAISQLRLITVIPGAVRDYAVTQDGSVYRLKIR